MFHFLCILTRAIAGHRSIISFDTNGWTAEFDCAIEFTLAITTGYGAHILFREPANDVMSVPSMTTPVRITRDARIRNQSVSRNNKSLCFPAREPLI